ncbi:hypothetical protein ACFU53_33415 [Streptomyces sp. NPDC057474]
MGHSLRGGRVYARRWRWPGNPVATPDFGLIGEVSLFGGFSKVPALGLT